MRPAIFTAAAKAAVITALITVPAMAWATEAMIAMPDPAIAEELHKAHVVIAACAFMVALGLAFHLATAIRSKVGLFDRIATPGMLILSGVGLVLAYCMASGLDMKTIFMTML